MNKKEDLKCLKHLRRILVNLKKENKRKSNNTDTNIIHEYIAKNIKR